MRKIEKQLGDYLWYCGKVRRMSEVTMHTKRNVLERFVRVAGIEDLAELTNEVFNKWVAYETTRGACARSVNTYNSVVIAMVKYYRGTGMQIPLNIALVGRLKEERNTRRFYTASEVEYVVASADFDTGLMIQIMFETGMRIAELTRLRVVNFEGRRVRFVGKGRKLREVYISEGTLQKLNEYIKKYGIRNYIWSVFEGRVTLNGEAPTINTIRKRMKEAFLQAGFLDFYPHALRHRRIFTLHTFS